MKFAHKTFFQKICGPIRFAQHTTWPEQLLAKKKGGGCTPQKPSFSGVGLEDQSEIWKLVVLRRMGRKLTLLAVLGLLCITGKL